MTSWAFLESAEREFGQLHVDLEESSVSCVAPQERRVSLSKVAVQLFEVGVELKE